MAEDHMVVLYQQFDVESALTEANVYEAAASEIKYGRMSSDLCNPFNFSASINNSCERLTLLKLWLGKLVISIL